LNQRAFSVLYEDDDIIAVNKQAGIAVTSGRGSGDTTKRTLDKLLDAYTGKKVFVLHRIDKETSGLVLFGKNNVAHRMYSTAFEQRLIHKTYLAIVHGSPAWPLRGSGDTIVCTLPLSTDTRNRSRTIVDPRHGKESCTEFSLIGTNSQYSVIECNPQTGRTHQIRVHLVALGFPIICDPLYGPQQRQRTNLLGMTRLALHAWRVELPNGVTLTAPPPKDMKNAFAHIKYDTL
jgi:RluA family pseudouridine synthase